ncbi:MAG: nitroreductase family protein [Omnitrophica WOR_2 bacterium]
MEFLEIIEKRYSVRAYKSDPVEDAKLQMVLNAARIAPTAANRQPFRLVVIHTAGKETALKRIYHREWFVSAPIIICVCALENEAWIRGYDGKNYVDLDVAIVMDHMILAATDLGLGTCWIAAFDPSAACQYLGLPKDVAPVVLTPLGYPASLPKPKERKPLSELVHYEQW